MAWEENSCISLNMQLIAILSRIGVIIFNNASVFLFFFMTITRLYHVRMTTAMVRTRTKVVETTGSQVVITEAGKEMTVLTIINNLRKNCASLFITDNLQENYVA